MWWGSGTRGSALASWPDWQLPLLSWTSLQLSKPSSPRKRKPLLLPSNDAPCCIATKMRVPRLFSPPHDVGSLPTLARRACRLRSGPACNGCHLPFSLAAPGRRSPLTLTGLQIPLPFTCNFAKTRLQTRASTPGRWFIVCARARRVARGGGTSRPPGPSPEP